MRSSSSTIVALAVASIVAIAPSMSGLRSQTPTRDPAAPAPALVTTSSLSGIVVLSGAAPTPIRRATVTVSSQQPAMARTAVTDDAGRFRVSSLPAGRFTLTVAKVGYVTTNTLRTPAPTVAVAEGQHVADVTLRLARGAAITGRVVDHHGLAVASAGVAIVERRQVGTQTTTRAVPSGGGPGGIRTDDRGVYRAFGLPAGTYVVGITPPASIGATIASATELAWARQPRGAAGMPPPVAAAVTHAAVYYPGTANLADARAVTVAAGEERSGVDVAFALVRTTEITGRVTWEDGQPAANAQIMAAPRTRPVITSGPTIPSRILPSGADGRFSVTGLVPGDYTILARAARPSTAGEARGAGAVPNAPTPGRLASGAPALPLLWAVAEITAAGQRIDDLALVLKPGLAVAGRLAFESATGQPPSAMDLGRASITLATVPDAGATLRVGARGAQADGSFVVEGLIPGSYVLTSSLSIPNGTRWLVKSATAGGRDVLDTPLEIRPDSTISDLVVTFTDRVSELSGRISDKLDRPSSEFYVIAFSIDQARWRQGSRWLAAPRRPTAEGRYSFTGLPPGEYYLAVVPEYEQTIWYTPEYLEQVVPGAIKITIGEGEKKVQDIRLGI